VLLTSVPPSWPSSGDGNLRSAPASRSEPSHTDAIAAAAKVVNVASDRVDATLKGFTRWARDASPKLSGDPDADAEELRLLLDLLRDHPGVDDPADLHPGDLRELLLRVYPCRVTVDTADTVPALRDLLTFLADTGAVTAKAAKRLARAG